MLGSWEICRRFGGTYRLYPAARTVSQVRNQREKAPISASKSRRYFPPKRRVIAELHGVTIQNTVEFNVQIIAPSDSPGILSISGH
jgi:hypothetical protein